jgi:SAM-dependent methyltransferase
MRSSQTLFESESFLPFIREDNKLRQYDQAVHDWYRFVLAFPPHLVRTYLDRFGVSPGGRVLDPFCGTGTTVVECKKLGIESVGIEANPLACFATRVKVSWDVDADALLAHAARVAHRASEEIRKNSRPLRTLSEV